MTFLQQGVPLQARLISHVTSGLDKMKLSELRHHLGSLNLFANYPGSIKT